MTTDFARMVADALKSERLTLLDLGCSGGIDPHWRAFGERFRALGIDASASECRRLASLEQHPDVHYRAAFVRVMPHHPAYPDFAGSPSVRVARSHGLVRIARCNCSTTRSRQGLPKTSCYSTMEPN